MQILCKYLIFGQVPVQKSPRGDATRTRAICRRVEDPLASRITQSCTRCQW